MRFKVVSESLLCMSLGNKVCGEAKNMEIGYFKGNKHVWIHTGDDYSEILGKMCNGSTITL